jgi:predicted nucleotidyltransferase
MAAERGGSIARGRGHAGYNASAVPTPSDRQNDAIVSELRRALGETVAVYRFGSTARGTATAASDIDIAVLARAPIDPARRFDLQEALAALVGADVDLADLARSSPVLAIQVITEGQLVHEGDPAARGAFEDRTFGAYTRLNEERRGILDRVAAEGTVYGR